MFCFYLPAYSQTITVDDTTNSPAQLVNLLLGNSCVEVSNISISSPQSVAYFNKNGSVFPINEGIIIRNGVANYSAGAYTGNNLNSQINSINDPYLQNLSNSKWANGFNNRCGFLEFDFVPLSSKFSFDFYLLQMNMDNINVGLVMFCICIDKLKYRSI